jgi:hypothetical protein
MNLQENIHRIQSMMGVITEDRKEMVIKNMIDDIGVIGTIKMMGGYSPSIEEHLRREDKIKLIKGVVRKLCEKYDDVEISSVNLNGTQIVYDETYEEKQVIEYYREDFIIVERYDKEVTDVEFDYDDSLLGSFEVPYEELSDSLINEIFHLMLEQI